MKQRPPTQDELVVEAATMRTVDHLMRITSADAAVVVVMQGEGVRGGIRVHPDVLRARGAADWSKVIAEQLRELAAQIEANDGALLTSIARSTPS